MTLVQARQIFSHSKLVRLGYDEPVSVRDTDTGIELYYHCDLLVGGILRLTGGLLRDEVVTVACEPDDINAIATIMLDGLKAQRR